MSLKSYALVAVTVLGSTAQASFDMMIVPDQVFGGYVRFDPINRVRLGGWQQFGARYAAANNSSSVGYYSYGNGTIAVDHFTGEQRAVQPGLIAPISLSGDGLFASYTFGGSVANTGNVTPNGIQFLSSQTSVSGAVFRGTASWKANRWVGASTTVAGLNFHIYGNTGGLLASALGQIPASDVVATSIGQPAVIRSSSGNDFIAIPYRDSLGQHRLFYRQIIESNGTFGFGGVQTPLLLSGFATQSTATLAVVASHVGFFVVGGDATTPTSARLTQFDSFSGGIIQSYTTTAFTPIVSSTWTMSNIVAPEPNTMIALGLGAAAWLRKRRRASNQS